MRVVNSKLLFASSEMMFWFRECVFFCINRGIKYHWHNGEFYETGSPSVIHFTQQCGGNESPLVSH